MACLVIPALVIIALNKLNAIVLCNFFCVQNELI